MFKSDLMAGCRLSVLRVSYNMRTTMEVIIGPGGPAWDDDAEAGTDLWTCVYRNHMTALKPLTAAHRRKLIHRFMASGDHPLVLEATPWEPKLTGQHLRQREIILRSTCSYNRLQPKADQEAVIVLPQRMICF